jgi:hypothetical protein
MHKKVGHKRKTTLCVQRGVKPAHSSAALAQAHFLQQLERRSTRRQPFDNLKKQLNKRNDPIQREEITLASQ